MKNQLFHFAAIFKVIIVSLVSTCSSQNQVHNSNSNGNSSLASSGILNFPTPGLLNSNNQINQHVLNNENDLQHLQDNNKNPKLDKVFGLDQRIFEEYLKDEDLTIIPGLRKEDDFENWIPPLELQRDIPCYMSGFDFDDRPIWIIEWGNWRFDKYVTTDEKITLFEKYIRYLVFTFLKSQAIRSTKERRVTQFMSLRDYEGFLPKDVTNRKILQLQLKVFSNYRRFYEKYAHKAISINVNPIVEIFLNLVRPFNNRLLAKIEIYGTNKYSWGPPLLKSFPKDQIPEWYGGYKGFVPFKRFGTLNVEDSAFTKIL